MYHTTLRLLILAALCLVIGMPVRADGPDYDLPGRLSLPWACGGAYRVTWGPHEHWARAKATGVAYDFGLPEGTPLYAPGSGRAYFLTDERPFETNYGHYVELVVGDDWLVRMAHLRDPQCGERDVRAGELIAYSGISGVSQAHLHLEVLVRSGSQWVRPDLSALKRLFGLPVSALTDGAWITNDGCQATLALARPPRFAERRADLGEQVDLVASVRNEGLQAAQIQGLEATLWSPSGASTVAAWETPRLLEGKIQTELRLPVRLCETGQWTVSQISIRTAEGGQSFALTDTITVVASPLRVLAVLTEKDVRVGRQLVLRAAIANISDAEVTLGTLWLEGKTSDGTPWEASSWGQLVLRAGTSDCIEFRCPRLPQHTGVWEVTRLGYERSGTRFYFARPVSRFEVHGPELVVEQIVSYLSEHGLQVLVMISNIGTEMVRPDAIEAWGWKPSGIGHFSLTLDKVPAIAAGASSLVRLEADRIQIEGVGQLVEIGYWVDGQYFRMERHAHMERHAERVLVLDPADDAE